MITGTQNIRTLALMLIVLVYLIFGAAVFNALESNEEVRLRTALRLKLARILYKNDTIQNETTFNTLTTTIFDHRYLRNGTAKQWTFPGAFYFSTLVVTLIGYGHITPKTVGGKIFCMVYTVAGVPLNLIMFQSVGERLNAFISFVLSRIKRCLRFRQQKVSGFELIAVEFGMTTMLVLSGSYVFSKQEKWSYFESIYYSLVTFLTIGFGDLVPLASAQRTGQSLYTQFGYYIFIVSFILFGLAIVASSLNLLVLRLAQFHSKNGVTGISRLLSGNEEELIAAAIAEHRASFCIQQRNRIYSNANSLIMQQQKTLSPYLAMKTYSTWSISSSTTTPSTSSLSRHSKFNFSPNSYEHTCCTGHCMLTFKKRKRRHWHIRRSPQNIKHLLYVNQLIENQKLAIVRKSLMPNQNHHSYANHVNYLHKQRKKRVSL